MAIHLKNVSCLEYSDNSVFYKKPSNIQVNEDARTKYASSQKIETLIEELKEKGPLVGLGKIGPGSYDVDPFKLNDQIHNQDVYGWKQGAKRKENSQQNYVIVLGAKKEQDSGYVFYTVSDDVTPNTTDFLRTHRPSSTDAKIYVASHKTFNNYLVDLYPPTVREEAVKKETPLYVVSSKPSKMPSLSASEKEYVEELCSISPLNSILDMGAGESKCKAIGQEIFDKYKQEAGGLTDAGREAVKKICNAILFSASDGSLRKQYVERAWDGIGDNNWRWSS